MAENSKVKERGILFRGEMVRALLDGRKTQTRRVGKIQSESYTELGVDYSNHATKGPQAVATYRAYPNGGTARWGICACPYGKPGDRLWVRESWAPSHMASSEFLYRADPLSAPQPARWFSSIHMPRHASRITLEILKVRVERVQDISEADAKAEGVTAKNGVSDPMRHRWAFKELWQKMRAGTEFGWGKNPWVWVLEFKKGGMNGC